MREVPSERASSRRRDNLNKGFVNLAAIGQNVKVKPEDHQDRMLRVLLCLEGLSLGDSFGQRFFHPSAFPNAQSGGRTLPIAPWYFTDDTIMALGVSSVLDQSGEIDSDLLAEEFARRFQQDPHRGYGSGAVQVLTSIIDGVPWKEASGGAFCGVGSLGNGGAMRSAPVGAYFAQDGNRLVEEAYKSAEVTHAHAEGQIGAAAVALAASYAANHQAGNTREGLLRFVRDHLPRSSIREGIAKAAEYGRKTKSSQVARELGCGHKVTARIPFHLLSGVPNNTYSSSRMRCGKQHSSVETQIQRARLSAGLLLSQLVETPFHNLGSTGERYSRYRRCRVDVAGRIGCREIGPVENASQNNVARAA